MSEEFKVDETLRIKIVTVGILPAEAVEGEDYISKMCQAVLTHGKTWDIADMENVTTIALPAEPHKDLGIASFSTIIRICEKLMVGDEFMTELVACRNKWKEVIGG